MNLLFVTTSRSLSYKSGVTITLAIPVSSSIEMKMKLLEQIPVTDTERKALEGNRKALQKLIGATAPDVTSKKVS